MLKVLKAIDTQSQRQALHDQKPSSAPEAPNLSRSQGKQPTKAKAQNVVDFLDGSDGAIGTASAADLQRFNDWSSDEEAEEEEEQEEEVDSEREEEAAGDDDAEEEASDLKEDKAEEVDLEEEEEDIVGSSGGGGDSSEEIGVSDGEVADSEDRADSFEEDNEEEEEVLEAGGDGGELLEEAPVTAVLSRRTAAVRPPAPREVTDVQVPSRAPGPHPGSGVLGVGPKGAGGRNLDLSRFGSDSEEEFRDVDSDGEREMDRAHPKAGTSAASAAAAAPRSVIGGRQESAPAPLVSPPLATSDVSKKLPSAALGGKAKAGGQPASKKGTKGETLPEGMTDGKDVEGLCKLSVVSPPKVPLESLRGDKKRKKPSVGADALAPEETVHPGPGLTSSSLPPTNMVPKMAKSVHQDDEGGRDLQQEGGRLQKKQSPAASGGSSLEPPKGAVTKGWQSVLQRHNIPTAPMAFSFSFMGRGGASFSNHLGSSSTPAVNANAAVAAVSAADLHVPDTTQPTKTRSLTGSKKGKQLSTTELSHPAQPEAVQIAGSSGGDGTHERRSLWVSPLASSSVTPGPLLTLGQSFVRPKDKSDEELRRSWDAQREALVADYKGKQRTALRHAGKAAGALGQTRKPQGHHAGSRR